MADVVLVHGTTQNAAGFAALVEELVRRGHRAIAVDIPSAGVSCAAQATTLVAEQIPADIQAPVVAAHSASGLFLPRLASLLSARHQVWLAAVVGDYSARRSFREEVLDEPDTVFMPEWIGGVNPAADPVLATYFLFHDADLATLQQSLPTVALCDLSALYAETPDCDPRRVPSTYLLPTEDRVFRRHWMEHVARDRLGIDPRRVPGGHNFYVASPRVVADTIDEIVDSPEL